MIIFSSDKNSIQRKKYGENIISVIYLKQSHFMKVPFVAESFLDFDMEKKSVWCAIVDNDNLFLHNFFPSDP